VKLDERVGYCEAFQLTSPESQVSVTVVPAAS
jgi:hypothetical protein